MLTRPLMAVALPGDFAVVEVQAVHHRCDSRQSKTAEKPTNEKAAKAQDSCVGDYVQMTRKVPEGNASINRANSVVRDPHNERGDQRRGRRDSKPAAELLPIEGKDSVNRR